MNDEHNYQKQMEKLEATNAALLEALEGCVEEMWRVFEEEGIRAGDAYTKATEAIRKAKGE